MLISFNYDQLTFEIRMRPCDTVGKCPLPCASYESVKMFKISTSEFGTMGMWVCPDEFLAMATEGVAHGV